MRKTLFTVGLILFGAILNAQTVNELIKLVQRSEQKRQGAINEGAVGIRLTQDATYYYLRMTLPDINQYEVSDGNSRYLTSTRRENSKKSLILP